MEPVRFGTGLFGFRRKQVLRYIDQTQASYQEAMTRARQEHEQAMQSQQADYEEKIRCRDDALQQEAALNASYEGEIDRLTQEGRQTADRLTQSEETVRSLTALLQAATEKGLDLTQQLDESHRAEQTAREQVDALNKTVAEKNAVIAQRAEELTRLQTHVNTLEEQLQTMQAETDQSTALVDCVNLLHTRNKALTQKVARLEARLQEQTVGREVQQVTAPVAGRQEVLKTAETLFATLRQELNDALHSLSDTIEHSAVSDPEEDNYVDMAQIR